MARIPIRVVIANIGDPDIRLAFPFKNSEVFPIGIAGTFNRDPAMIAPVRFHRTRH
jgi:hypothetical protein